MLKFNQLNEISKGLRDKYVAKATAAHGHYNMARRNTTGADQEYFARKEKNTQKGISRALDDKRLNKESTDACHVCGQTPCNCTSIEEAKATMCGRCGTKHVPPAQGGKCSALAEASLPSGSMVPGIPSKRDTAVKSAVRRAAVVPVEKAKATYGVGYRQESVDEARGINTASTRAAIAKRKTTKPLTPDEQIAKDRMKFEKWKAKQQGKTTNEEVQIDEIKMTDDEYKDKVNSYGKRATNLLKHSWDQHDISREKAKAGDKEGAAKAQATGSRAHKLFLKAQQKHLQNPTHADNFRNKIMSGASDYYKSKKPGEYTGDSFDPTLTNSNPYLGEGLVDEAKEASYDGNYQSAVLRFRDKVKKQEQERGPVDIQKLAARLRAVKLKPEGTKK
jgi:hypothetical protein